MTIAFKNKKKGLWVAQCCFSWAFLQLVGTHVAKEAGSAAQREDASDCCCAARRRVDEQPGTSWLTVAVEYREVHLPLWRAETDACALCPGDILEQLCDLRYFTEHATSKCCDKPCGL